MTVPAARLTGDSHGQSNKETRCGAQEEPKTRQGKHQACAQDGCKARDTEKSEIQDPARGHECEETRGQEKAATGDSGKNGMSPVQAKSEGSRTSRLTASSAAAGRAPAGNCNTVAR